MRDWPTIDTGRLLLRPWRTKDFEPYVRMSSDEEVMRFLSRDGLPTDRVDSWRAMAMIVGHWYLRGFTMWAVEERSSGEFVGRVGPWMPEGWPDLEIGWAIERSRWGRGYATEAARAASAYVHREIGADHVIHLIHPDNARSVRVAEKLCARPSGMFVMPGGAVELTVWRTDLPVP